MTNKIALWIEPKNIVGALGKIAGKIAGFNGNILYIEQFERAGRMWLYVEIETDEPDKQKTAEKFEILITGLKELDVVLSVENVSSFSEIYGKRIIVIGGGALVAAVANGAISEADRHNIRGERISVDTIPVIGEYEIAEAVRGVARLPRAKTVILAGSLMGGEISKAVEEVKKCGITVISLNMAGSVPDHADLVVTDPIQAGVMAVMDVASTAKFTIDKLKSKKRVF
ncbi:MAG: hypothetical protein GW779_00700 [Candidatus Altiarchaeum hamiconexum]|uniref:ACT domain-containing protein n=1 Tax=Candidatus Altarchaeum hamiconexum TaxID=1803513 RepID=A0A8J8CFD5_9ARCH|nr:hypothetical protein [Candidatus Altarchaeum hamiconexum]OIQ05531.1 MAG: hypothetical protein AUK59_03540 [Candidatus Altarchaeum sp. CG2_30_32_3053]PIN66901.1 MAG: hypothetical protein COV98_05805 [Candidatus Altarchaeum sp. CG12_big_fil_rev_8_21_14_0_65_33_22]PIV27640.1 MAG: hypothetical protein COS36_05100 [Candidatus Altarchaeum sp. CG03_land_8_20_14_0_80_32_618]PIX48254.1 MAG: hypothetical protein COZ53_04680 [Candidatus Altarchaeum sp. CG_4_8_14_3_um_filter_33_2054]PIZ32559.1 MAG: hyp